LFLFPLSRRFAHFSFFLRFIIIIIIFFFSIHNQPIPPPRQSTAVRFTPLSDRVLVRAAEIVRQSKGGVILPESVNVSSAREGTVVAVGAGRVTSTGTIAPAVKAGDTVLFPKEDFVGKKITVDGEEFLMVREEDLYGVLAKK
jgi:chaperonin GroES